MKREIFRIAVVAIMLFNYSCGHQSKDKSDHQHAEEVEKTDHHDSSEAPVVLNNGKQWIANPETTVGINNMINIMDSFSEKDNVAAFKKLTQDLQEELDGIFKKCTMDGEGHNQLHNFLIPVKNLLEDMGSSDLSKCRESYEKLRRHLSDYNKFFK